MDKEAGVGQADAIFLRGGEVDVGARAGDPAGADNFHTRTDEFDHVVDGVACLHMTALRVDEQSDVVVAVMSQREEVIDHPRRHLLINGFANKYLTRLEQAICHRVGTGLLVFALIVVAHGNASLSGCAKTNHRDGGTTMGETRFVGQRLRLRCAFYPITSPISICGLVLVKFGMSATTGPDAAIAASMAPLPANFIVATA